MSLRVLTPALLALSFALPAAAAPSSTNQSSSSNQSDQASSRPTPQIAAKLRESLTQAGFTDVHLKDGNPVMMVVNPDSGTSITALGTSSNGRANSTTGSSKSAAGGDSAMSTPQHGSNGTTKE